MTRARILEQAHRPAEALAALEGGVSKNPLDFKLNLSRAELLEQQGQLHQAYAAYTQTIQLLKINAFELRPRLLLKRRALGFQMNREETAQRDWLRDASVSGRDPAIPSHCLDLSPHYNAALNEAWHDRKRTGNDLSQVRPGHFVTHEVEFDVRGIVQLAGIHLDAVEPGFPKAVNGISVNRACEALHFLHAAGWGFSVPDATTVGRYIVHYADGEAMAIVLKKNVDLDEWFHQGPSPLSDLAGARTVDMGHNAARVPLRLFLKTWSNPRPGVPITTMDFVSEMTGAAPFLLAVTAEP
jgi:hypothetical protein